MLLSFEDHWIKEAKGREDVIYKEGKDFDSYLVEGKTLLATYYQKSPDDGYRVLGIEEPFFFYIPKLPIPIIGVIDLIEEDNSGTIVITDFKTSSRAYSLSETEKDFQLTVYQMAAKANGFRDREILLRFDCLIKTQIPRFEQYYTFRSETDEKRAIVKIRKVWEGITKEVFIPNDTSWKCKGCVYKDHCNDYFNHFEEDT